MKNRAIESCLTLTVIAACTLCRVFSAAFKHDCTEIKGQPAFWDTTEKRCSPCSIKVCEVQNPIPNHCLCHCVKNFSGREYSIEERGRCGASPTPDPTLTPGPVHYLPPLPELIWLVILSLVVLILVFKTFGKQIKKVLSRFANLRKVNETNRTTLDESRVPLNRPTAPQVSHPPVEELVKVPVDNMATPVTNGVPLIRQPTPDEGQSDQTGVKCSGIADNQREVTTAGGGHHCQAVTSGPSEGVPGPKYRLLNLQTEASDRVTTI